jgi:hypothetical protein
MGCSATEKIYLVSETAHYAVIPRALSTIFAAKKNDVAARNQI